MTVSNLFIGDERRNISEMVQAMDGLTLSQVCAMTGLEASTIQNWVKRNYVARPFGRSYYERQVARIFMIAALREVMPLDTIGELLTMINGDANDESDDIISEEKLYEFFCRLVQDCNDELPTVEETSEYIDELMIDYLDDTASPQAKILKDALTVMVFAYTSAEYKKLATGKLNQMKEEYKK